MLAFILGCGSRPPYLRPPIEIEELNDPPNQTRYDSSNLPDEVLNQPDEGKKKSKVGLDGMKAGPNMGMPGGGSPGGGMR